VPPIIHEEDPHEIPGLSREEKARLISLAIDEATHKIL